MRSKHAVEVERALQAWSVEAQDLEARYKHARADMNVDRTVSETLALRLELDKRYEECERSGDEQAWEGLRRAVEDGLNVLRKAVAALEESLKRPAD